MTNYEIIGDGSVIITMGIYNQDVKASINEARAIEAAAREAYETYFGDLIGSAMPHWLELPLFHQCRLVEANRAAIIKFLEYGKDAISERGRNKTCS